MRSGSKLLAALLTIFVGAVVFAEDPQPDTDEESQSIGCTPAERRAGCTDSESRASQSGHIPTNDAGRLGQLWTGYQAYKGVNAGIFDRCQSLGVETARARAANQKFDEPVEPKIPILRARLQEALRGLGYLDPAARMREIDGQVDVAIKAAVDEMFAKAEAKGEKLTDFCQHQVLDLERLESSFRFTDFYERVMAITPDER